jgi:MFS family permease
MLDKDRRVPLATASLLLLIAINLFNYIDRQVLAAVEPQIRRELKAAMQNEAADQNAGGLAANLEPGGDLSGRMWKFLMGLLATAFLVSYMLFAPLFSWLAEYVSRWKLIGIGVILWSLASGASGWDWHVGSTAAYLILLATRCFVGVGEGGYGPVAPAMISDLFPVERRGQIMAWFFLAIPVGGALGYAFGALMVKYLSWRWAFYLVVPPGLVLGGICFFMRDPPRGQMEDAAAGTKRGLQKYLGLFRIPSFVLNTLGMTAMTFTVGGLAFWMPDFLEIREVAGLPIAGAGDAAAELPPQLIFGVITAVAGLFATLCGGWAGDRLRTRYSGAYFLVSGGAMLLGFPMIVAFIYAPFPWAWVFVFLAVFCLFFNTGPTNTILANVTHPAVRSNGFALNILIIHLFGDVISPPLIGLLSELHGENIGFLLLAVVTLLGGIFWIWGAAYLQRDTQLAGTRG